MSQVRLMKWITTHNRGVALTRFARLLELGPQGRPLRDLVAQ
jgi:hypothetical protein